MAENEKPLRPEERWAAWKGQHILTAIEETASLNSPSKELFAIAYIHAFLATLIIGESVSKKQDEVALKRCQRHLSSVEQEQLRWLVVQAMEDAAVFAERNNLASLDLYSALALYMRASHDLYAKRGKQGLPTTLKGLLGTAAIAGGLVILATFYISRQPRPEEPPVPEE